MDWSVRLDYRDMLNQHYYEVSELGETVRSSALFLEIDAGSLVKIFQKKLHLPERCVPKAMEWMKIPSSEEVYFKTLYQWNRAKKEADIRAAYMAWMALLNQEAQTVNHEYSEVLAKWHRITFFHALQIKPYNGNSEEWAARLRPPVSNREIEENFKILRDSGFLSQNEDGTWSPNQKSLFPENCPVSLLRNTQTQFLDLAKNALQVIPPEERRISSLTLHLSSEAVKQIEEEIAQSFARIKAIAQASENDTEVRQFQVQFFPLLQGEVR